MIVNCKYSVKQYKNKYYRLVKTIKIKYSNFGWNEGGFLSSFDLILSLPDILIDFLIKKHKPHIFL